MDITDIFIPVAEPLVATIAGTLLYATDTGASLA
jgi:hypothetical protein